MKFDYPNRIYKKNYFFDMLKKITPTIARGGWAIVFRKLEFQGNR
jgi:hypothetical protein